MHIDRNTGIIEMFMEKLQDEDEGTYTFQLQDGKATGHSTLVLIGDGKKSCTVTERLFPLVQIPYSTKVVTWKAAEIVSCISNFGIQFQLILSVFHQS